MVRCAAIRWGLVLALAFAGGVGSAAEPQRVLLIHSFGRGFEPYDTVAGHLRTELVRRSPGALDLYEVSIESARFARAPSERPMVDYLLARFAERRLDLVVLIGGPAAQFAQRHRGILFPETPMLYAATDERHVERLRLTTHDTVVAVRNDLKRLVDQILEVLPETRQIAVVLGSSPLERFWVAEFQRAVGVFTNRVDFVWLHELPFAEMVERCAHLPSRSAILFALLSVDAAGVPQLEHRALAQLHAAANAPLFGVYDSQLGRGIVGGGLMGVEDIGRTAAQVGIRLLAGEPPSAIQTPPLTVGVPQYDWRELQRWKIREKQLPPGSKVLYRQPTFWELYRGRIVALVALCLFEAVLVVVLVVNRLRRRRAEQAARESEERLSLATAAAQVGVWMWHLGTNEVWATADWRRMFGFAPDARLSLEAVMARVHPDDRAAVEHGVRRAVEQRSDYVGEYRLTMPDGTPRWIVARGRVDPTGSHSPARMLGASVDVTERKRAESEARDLTGRLLRAQEQERARLARELHDDITQRLARLAIDVGRLEQGTAELPPAETAREVREGLVRLSDDVHALSYQLHPSVLEDLGLAEALEAEADHYRRREAVPVSVRIQGVPESVPREAALCLFRVAQEALRNVARHAQARTVEVALRGRDDGLQLAVHDDGRGFNPAKPGDRPSLGLASMQERVHLIGGELEIDTAPGRGTTVVAWIPLPPRCP